MHKMQKLKSPACRRGFLENLEQDTLRCTPVQHTQLRELIMAFTAALCKLQKVITVRLTAEWRTYGNDFQPVHHLWDPVLTMCAGDSSEVSKT
jgi:hypothetical protein